jgi:Ca2+-binding EF-hand superfamily protein
MVDKNRDGYIDYESEFLPWLEIAKGNDEPATYSFSVEAAERQKKKAAKAVVKEKMNSILDKLRTAAYDNGHANWLKLFRHYDRDDTGDMDLHEFMQLLRKRARITPKQLTDEQIAALFEFVDQDKNGTISYREEFLPWLEVRQGEDTMMKERSAGNEAGKQAAQRRRQRAAQKELTKNLRTIVNKLRACAYDNSQGDVNWHKLFKFHDHGGTGECNLPGFLTIIRTKARIKQQDLSDDALRALFNHIDSDNSGTISYETELLPWLEEESDSSAALSPGRTHS